MALDRACKVKRKFTQCVVSSKPWVRGWRGAGMVRQKETLEEKQNHSKSPPKFKRDPLCPYHSQPTGNKLTTGIEY